MKCPYVIKVCTKCGELLVANEMNFTKEKGGKWGLRAKCKECNKDYAKKNYRDNKEHILEQKKQYREEKKEYYKEKGKQWRESNPKYFQQWKEDNPDKVFNSHNKRRQLEENQGSGFSKEQWLEMMNFFEWKCAYSGIVLSKETRSIDHINPLNKGGINEIWNLVPMYLNYNSSKNTKDMLSWYREQEFYSEERLNKIYQWIEYAKNKYKED